MESELFFAPIGPDLFSTFEDLRSREPIFHRVSFGTSLEDFERMMAPDYFEIGASGRRYDREFILRHLAQNPPIDADVAGWVCSEFGLKQLCLDTFLLTYRLDQCGRVSQRATIWQSTLTGWQIVFHQGTIVTEK